jgi:hypothetical protein
MNLGRDPLLIPTSVCAAVQPACPQVSRCTGLFVSDHEYPALTGRSGTQRGGQSGTRSGNSARPGLDQVVDLLGHGIVPASAKSMCSQPSASARRSSSRMDGSAPRSRSSDARDLEQSFVHLRRHHRDPEGDHRPQPGILGLTWSSTTSVLPISNTMLVRKLELAVAGKFLSRSGCECRRVGKRDVRAVMKGPSGRALGEYYVSAMAWPRCSAQSASR